MNVKILTPGNGWYVGKHRGIYENKYGDRVMPFPHNGFITLKRVGDLPFIMRDNEDPLKSAIRRNGLSKRAGLAAARYVFEEVRR